MLILVFKLLSPNIFTFKHMGGDDGILDTQKSVNFTLLELFPPCGFIALYTMPCPGGTNMQIK